MKQALFLLLIFLLAACNTPTVEDGDAFPTRPDDTPTLAAQVTATAIPATPTTLATATDAPTATSTAEATAVSSADTPVPPTVPAEEAPMRIQFDPGATSITLNGTLTAGESREYLAWAAQGQHMRVELDSTGNAANFSITGVSDGQPYKRLVNEDRFWDGTLPESQDYRIRVFSLEDVEYTLDLAIDPLGENVLQPVWPIVDTTSGFLLGGSHNGEWLDALAVMPSLQDGERTYHLYAGSAFHGEFAGSPPTVTSQGPCSGSPVVTFSPEADLAGMIALVARWEPAPRQPEALPLDTAVYQDAVGALLQSQGISEPQVELTSVYRIDLEGDGVDEVLITATHLTGLGSGLPTVAAGDYSLVLLRKVVDEEVMTIPLVLQVFPEAIELADPVQYNVLALLDLDGDGSLEIVIEGWRYEGRDVSVYSVVGENAEAVLTVGCQL